jgi:hypothetical protein
MCGSRTGLLRISGQMVIGLHLMRNSLSRPYQPCSSGTTNSEKSLWNDAAKMSCYVIVPVVSNQSK